MEKLFGSIAGFEERFVGWCKGLEPKWIGTVIFVSTTTTLVLLVCFVVPVVVLIGVAMLVAATPGWIFIGIPLFVLYVLWIALFCQPKE